MNEFIFVLGRRSPSQLVTKWARLVASLGRNGCDSNSQVRHVISSVFLVLRSSDHTSLDPKLFPYYK